MQSRKLSMGVAVVALGIAVALFFVLRDDGGGDSDSDTPAQVTTETTTPGETGEDEPGGGGGQHAEPKPQPDPEQAAEIVVRGGQPVGGVAELEFTKGERIRFVVRSDVADHVHLHGYDVFMDIAAGGRVEFDVPATIDGVFEVELEDRVVPLAEITVNPG
ncbi:MAG: hypothetical protein ACRDKX_05290 [Solirubrobacterales bacterium]